MAVHSEKERLFEEPWSLVKHVPQFSATFFETSGKLKIPAYKLNLLAFFFLLNNVAFVLTPFATSF